MAWYVSLQHPPLGSQPLRWAHAAPVLSKLLPVYLTVILGTGISQPLGITMKIGKSVLGGPELSGRQLPPCPQGALVPLKYRNLQFPHRVPFTEEKMPRCPCPFKIKACFSIHLCPVWISTSVKEPNQIKNTNSKHFKSTRYLTKNAIQWRQFKKTKVQDLKCLLE